VLTFLVGADTASRIASPRFYGGVEGMNSVLRQLCDAGTDFLVAGRNFDGAWRADGGDEVQALPREFQNMFSVLPESVFREDISSTAIRNARDAAQ